MVQNIQNLNNYDGEGETTFKRAYVDGNLGHLKITAGRYNDTIADGNIYDNQVDGIKAILGKEIKLTAAYGRMSNADFTSPSPIPASFGGKYWRVGLNSDIGKVGLEANYVHAKDVNAMGMELAPIHGFGTSDIIWTLGAKYKEDNWTLGATFLKGNNDLIKSTGKSQNGVVAAFTLGGAKASKPGTFGFNANYYNQAASTVISHTMDGAYEKFPYEGFKGYKLGADYTVAKNMVAGVSWYDLKGKVTGGTAKTLWSQLVITF